MSDSPLLSVHPLGFPWETDDPFLFCVHHNDAYPAGNERMGPAASLAGRHIGADFSGKDGWSMYHGDVIPGFPRHPHRGFETVTLARRGFIDHSDSLGATARFGKGDVQWMTAGKGIVHAEMFPLVERDTPNPVELFQIWLNLPREDKMVEPHFAMLWGEQVPTIVQRDADGRETHVTVVAGRLGDVTPASPPPRSWAARPDTDVAVWTLRMQPGACWTLPPAQPGTNRSLYLFQGSGIVAGNKVPQAARLRLRAEMPVELEAGDAGCELLLLQGRPIDEPVVQHGPFVMNTPAEIHQAFRDYHTTGFGGWPWQGDGPVHSREAGRFARHADGREESPIGATTERVEGTEGG